jgi:hypothetical protein
MYARTTSGLLGKIDDSFYGYLESDFICQFYCPDGFEFSHTPAGGHIDSVELRLYYKSWVGDSLAPMQVQVFRINKELERNFYTNFDPDPYRGELLGTQVYTPFDYTVPDTTRYKKDSDSTYTFYPQISILLDRGFGQEFYEHGSFASQEDFNDFLKGLYVTTGFGSGNVIQVDLSHLNIYYHYTITGSEGQDSLVQGGERFGVTREVLQLNRAKHKDIDIDKLTDDNGSFTYLKTPSGVYTHIVIPVTAMRDSLEGRIINHVPFEPSPMPLVDEPFAFPRPPYLLLLPVDSISSFFENNRIENNTSSFLFTYNASTNTYQYGVTTYDSYSSTLSTTYSVMNISGLVKLHLEEGPEDKDLELALIPVSRQTQTSYSTVYTSSLSHYLFPAAVTLRKDSAKTALPIIVGKYGH